MREQKELAQVSEELFERVWKIVTEIGEAERHFNQLQHGYRTLASTWLIATFGAVGFLFSEKGPVFPFDRFLLTAGIGMAGGIGIVLLWALDLLVYHRLLDAYFVEGLKIEKNFAWLPSFRTNMLRATRGESVSRAGVLNKVVWFYVGSSGIAMLISLISLGVWLKESEIHSVGFWLTLYSAACGVFLYVMSRATLSILPRAIDQSRLEGRSSGN